MPIFAATICSLCLNLNREESAKDAFLATMDHYSKLESMSVDIENDNSSGLFSGKFRQQLIFKKGKGFKLVSTELYSGKRPDNVSPDYYCDGVNVTTVGRFEGTRPLNKDANTMPGYEVAGGLIMTWLLDSPTKNFFSKPPSGMEVTMAWGPRKTWHDESVVEVILTATMASQKDASVVSIFMDPEHKKLIGDEWTREGKTGWALYKNQKDNPEVNPSDFKPPVKK